MKPINKSSQVKAGATYRRWVFLIAKLLAVLQFTLLHRLTISRTRPVIPATGPVLVAANHTSYLDPIIVSHVMPRRTFYLAWAPLFGNRFFATIIRSLGAVPLDSQKGSDLSAYRTALKLLEEGETLGIFPEGARGDQKELMPLQPGLFRLAVRTGAPILPIRIDGALDIWSKHRRWPRLFGRIDVAFGELIRVEDFPRANEKETMDALREATRQALSPRNSAGTAGRQPGTP